MDFTERSTRAYKTKQLYSKEELAVREALCVHEQPAFCTAACPLRIDARELTRLCADGDFTAARAMLERAVPFAQILAAGCEAPCADACRLSECGAESVDICALERAAMRHGQPRTGRGLLKFRKKKTAAVFGAELFSLVVAAELAGKSYPTVFYVSAPGAEELISDCAPFMCPEDAATQAAALEKLDLKIVYGCELSGEFIASEKDEYDLVCVSREAYALLGGSGPDPVTLCDSALGVLARPGADASVIGAFYDARRAGVSADRLAQGMAPDSARGGEGPVTSTLYTDLSAVTPSRRVAESGVYSPGEAQSEAARCIKCECTECIKGCAWLQHYGKFPRIMTREIYNNVGIIMGDHMMNGAINSCALCSQCTVTCPNGYDMAEICLSARRNMVDTGKMSLAVHEFALLDQLFSNGEAFLCLAEPGFEKCEYVFFPGCQAGAVAPEAVWRTYADLRARLGGGVAILLGCCGIISRWAGREELFNETLAQLRDALASLGNPKIITACPTCTKTLTRLGECTGVWDILLEIGLPADAPHAVGEVTLHDACGARGDAHTQRAVRGLAGKLGCSVAVLRLRRAGRLRQAGGRRGDDLLRAGGHRRRTAHLLHGLPRPVRPCRGRERAHTGAGLRRGGRRAAGDIRKAAQPPGAQAQAAAGHMGGGRNGRAFGLQAGDNGRGQGAHGGAHGARHGRCQRHARIPRERRGRARKRHRPAGDAPAHRQRDLLGQVHRGRGRVHCTSRVQPPHDHRNEVNHG